MMPLFHDAILLGSVEACAPKDNDITGTKKYG